MNPIRELTSNEIDHVSGGPAPVVVVIVVRVATSPPAVKIAKSLGTAAVGAATAIITDKILDSGGDD